MEASKVSFSKETLRFTKMTRGKKANLRRQNIIDLINSRSYGSPISLTEFAVVTASSQSSAYALIKSMVKKGIITKQVISPRRTSYSVNGEVKVVKPVASIKPTNKVLGDYAKEFAWDTNSDSLREFVKFMDNKELDLRRQMGGV